MQKKLLALAIICLAVPALAEFVSAATMSTAQRMYKTVCEVRAAEKRELQEKVEQMHADPRYGVEARLKSILEHVAEAAAKGKTECHHTQAAWGENDSLGPVVKALTEQGFKIGCDTRTYYDFNYLRYRVTIHVQWHPDDRGCQLDEWDDSVFSTEERFQSNGC